MPVAKVGLDDKFDLDRRQIYLSGTQAIVRLCLMQRARDRAAGLATGGYVTGYRGSPLGGVDQQFWRAATVLAPADIHFQPAINEDLAATALWGAQQVAMRGEGRVDGVFGIWYGKGPGVDRSGDAFRHANLAGTSPEGGVIALMGDDHTCESSTTAHQSEFALVDAMMPVLSPAGVQEVLDYGLAGFALSRLAGVWTGLKAIKDTIESSAVVDGAVERMTFRNPEDFAMPPGGVSIRPGDNPLAQEARLHEFKLPAALAFLRENALDQMVFPGGARPRIGIVTLGKSYLDVRQALDRLGIDRQKAADYGLRLLKLACAWPVEPEIIRSFAEGLETIIVVEEKRGLVEPQIKDILYGTAGAPRILGKRDEAGGWLFPVTGALDGNRIAIEIGERVLAYSQDEELPHRIAAIERAEHEISGMAEIAERRPTFCAGCPHNTSTVVPAGERAYAGIGCHYMAQWMDRATEGYTQMGGEGANWIGEAPFSKRGHVFQNIGDGTYNHSGYLAIRAAAAAGVNVTYKILYNDAVAMTGGQPNDGGLTVPQIAAQMAAEGAKRLAIVADDTGKYPAGTPWPFGTTLHDRDEFDAVQRELAGVEGLSVLIYDQTCAAEKRRRRKRGTYPDPDTRVFIHPVICEGCGDCGVQSNCVAIRPLETEFGVKRQIDQSSCNKDFSCLKGFCPAMVTVTGAVPKRRAGADIDGIAPPPAPERPGLERPWSIAVSGIGGTGIVTIGQIIGMAAHIDGRGVGIIDMAGLAQKGGAVTSHIRIARSPDDIQAIRIAAGEADLVIGGDLVVAASPRVLGLAARGRTRILLDPQEVPTPDFTRNIDASLPVRRLMRAIETRVGGAALTLVPATRLGADALGDTVTANMILLGAAYQAGGLPISAEALEAAIRLNGVAVDRNFAAFRLGRQSIAAPEAVAALIGPEPDTAAPTLDGRIARRARLLGISRNAAAADRFLARIAAIRAAEERNAPGATALTEAAADGLFRLMAVKDEYEVARLLTDGSLDEALATTFEKVDGIAYHMAPPFLTRTDPATGRPKKRRFGARWKLPLAVLARLRGLRGTILDPFARTADRRDDRHQLAAYEAVLDEIAEKLTPDRHDAAVALAFYAEMIRGFGPVRAANAAAAEAEAARRLAAFRAGPKPAAAVARPAANAPDDAIDIGTAGP